MRMKSRREFIRGLGAGIAFAGLSGMPMQLLASSDRIEKITILHTNDVHSRIDPFPMDGGKYQGLGGAARRAALIGQIRKQEQHVLLLDSGDIFQGTPYFNVFKGELEFKLMNEMGYDAATIGNHDFDGGMQILADHTSAARFPMLSSNYDFSDTQLHNLTRPYHIIQKGSIKVGLFGIGIELDGLVPAALYGNTQYQDPLERANAVAKSLRNDHGCQLVICLSHLGLEYESNKISDIALAERSANIDLILGGHTHSFLDEPRVVKNKDSELVVVNQAGWAGILLGRVDFYFKKGRKLKRSASFKKILVN